MQYFPQQQQYGGFLPQFQQQCLTCPGYNNYFSGYYQQQPQAQQYSPFNAVYPQQYYYPQQQQQRQQQFYYPQQQYYYPQQQYYNWPQPFSGQNVYGSQQYWPQQQRVFEDPPTPSPPPSKHQKKGESKYYYDAY